MAGLACGLGRAWGQRADQEHAKRTEQDQQGPGKGHDPD
jgi:hypothetical protein